MPKVLGYWQMPDEERTLLTEISNYGAMVAFSAVWHLKKEDVRPQPLLQLLEGDNPPHVRLALASQVHLVSVEQQLVDGQPRWGVALMPSCVIDYRRGQLANGRLTLSNVAAYPDRLSEDGSAVVKKEKDFVDWIDKVFKRLRRATPEWHLYRRYRATKAAKAACLAGTLELVPY